jgi:hypothetical protein
MPTSPPCSHSEAWHRIPPARFIIFLALAGALLAALALDGDGYLSILDDANLLFHEAGHVISGCSDRRWGSMAARWGNCSSPLFS